MSDIDSSAPRFIAPALPADAPEVIDRSLRLPVTVAGISAIKWMAFGLAFLIIASLQRHLPDLFSGASWLTHGRVLAAGQNAVVYGFGFQVAFLAILWVMSRLNRQLFRYSAWAVVGLF